VREGDEALESALELCMSAHWLPALVSTFRALNCTPTLKSKFHDEAAYFSS